MLGRSRFLGRAVLVLIALLAGAAVIVLNQQSGAIGQQASAADDGRCCTNAVKALALQLAPNSDGLALIDTENETISLYQYMPRRGPSGQLVLLAVRSYRDDRRLKEYNTAEPTPATVRQWLLRGEKIQKASTAVEDSPAQYGEPARPAASEHEQHGSQD